jgi:hypothetical protein
MFQIDRFANRLRKLERISFSEVGFREREHLQEWLAAMPDALCEAMSEGEDGLLIIQKEFDGFDGTRERLDLLALDRAGQLVIIENKLDDSGRDVVWQALKYAAYCSSLKKAEIVGIFQQYVDRQGGGDAAALICEFLGEDALDEVVLNDGTNQRVLFIAANFRREVTATVLWLRKHQIDARCVKVVPYRFGEEVFVDLQQIIPTPEAADYMIRMAEKDSEEESSRRSRSARHQIRRSFWEQALPHLREHGSSRYNSVGPTDDNWLSVGTGMSGCIYSLVLRKDQVRVELVIQRPQKDTNEWVFDQLLTLREALEAKVGCALDWRRQEASKKCTIAMVRDVDGFDAENWPDITKWLADGVAKFEAAFAEPISMLNHRIKSGEAA